MPEEVETEVLAFALEQPAYGQLRVSNELAKQGIKISGQGVRGIWLRHSLHTMKLRLAALEKKMAEENLILTESQLQALNRRSGKVGRLRLFIQDTLVLKILSTLERLKEWDEYINRHTSTHIRSMPSVNFT